MLKLNIKIKIRITILRKLVTQSLLYDILTEPALPTIYQKFHSRYNNSFKIMKWIYSL